jgi:hypothetical protein
MTAADTEVIMRANVKIFIVLRDDARPTDGLQRRKYTTKWKGQPTIPKKQILKWKRDPARPI